MRRVALLLCLVTSGAVPHAQSPTSPDAYLQIVRQFAAGGSDAAFDALEAWPQASVRAAVDAVNRRTAEPKLIQASALLETELAFSLIIRNAQAEGRFHLDLAQSSVKAIPKQQGDVFRRSWYVVAGVTFLKLGKLNDARRYVDAGLGEFSADADLRAASGMVYEAVAVSGTGTVITSFGRRFDPTRMAFFQATRDYQAALQANGSLVHARLRLGRVLALLESARDARQELSRVIEAQPDPIVEYLAHLFLGRLAADAGDTTAAAAEYDAARWTNPDATAPYLALAELADRNGDREAARSYLDMVSAPPQSDPWWNYLLGGADLRERAIGRLRAEIQP